MPMRQRHSSQGRREEASEEYDAHVLIAWLRRKISVHHSWPRPPAAMFQIRIMNAPRTSWLEHKTTILPCSPVCILRSNVDPNQDLSSHIIDHTTDNVKFSLSASSIQYPANSATCLSRTEPVGRIAAVCLQCEVKAGHDQMDCEWQPSDVYGPAMS